MLIIYHLEQYPTYYVPNYLKIMLLVCNMLQVSLEIALFLRVYSVLCSLGKFLKSFQKGQLSKSESEVVKNT